MGLHELALDQIEENPIPTEAGQSAKRVSTRSKLWPLALERFRRRARTDAPMFFISLGIDGQRFKIGPDHSGNASPLCLPGNLRRRRLALAQRLLETLDGD